MVSRNSAGSELRVQSCIMENNSQSMYAWERKVVCDIIITAEVKLQFLTYFYRCYFPVKLFFTLFLLIILPYRWRFAYNNNLRGLTLPCVLLRQPSGCFLVMFVAQNTLSVQCKQAWVTKKIHFDSLYFKDYRWQKSKWIDLERVFGFRNLNSRSCALPAQRSIFCWLSSCRSPPFIYGTTSSHLKAVKNFITCMLVCHTRNHLQFGLWTRDFPYCWKHFKPCAKVTNSAVHFSAQRYHVKEVATWHNKKQQNLALQK